MGGTGEGVGYGGVRITYYKADFSQTEIQYPVNFRHHARADSQKTETHSTKIPSFKEVVGTLGVKLM